MAAHNHVALLLLPLNVQRASACSAMISKSRNIRWLKRFAAVEARASHRARGIAGMARDPGGRSNAHTLDAPARDLVAVPTSAATAAVRCPRVRADRSPADRAAVPPASAPLRRKRAVAHDGEAQFSTGVTPALGAGHPVDRVHRSRVPGGNPRFSPKISEVKATDQQRPAQAPRCLHFWGKNGSGSRGDCGGQPPCRKASGLIRFWTATASGCAGLVACHRLAPAPRCPGDGSRRELTRDLRRSELICCPRARTPPSRFPNRHPPEI